MAHYNHLIVNLSVFMETLPPQFEYICSFLIAMGSQHMHKRHAFVSSVVIDVFFAILLPT